MLDDYQEKKEENNLCYKSELCRIFPFIPRHSDVRGGDAGRVGGYSPTAQCSTQYKDLPLPNSLHSTVYTDHIVPLITF